ncbi:MAG TPA: 5-methyltetrahydrofolate--homocysteine methyltransferase [Candidatus Alistipes cottocaccae]|nr:5-methyltetrahydrofolate--homocysteine methyltransferase [Candidatus Alistipes cottocaccae]
MMYHQELAFRPEALDRREILRTLGGPNYRPDGQIDAMIDRMIFQELPGVCRPEFGYARFEAEAVGRNSIRFAGTEFRVGPIIADGYTGAESFAVFVATAGRDFDRWIHGEGVRSDLVRQFVADAIGSEIAEWTAREAADSLRQAVAAEDARISNSYSPGYCGWNVVEQHRLFALLPDHPCGIELGASALMKPEKSVSGIIAVGRNVEKKPYGCAICTRRSCYKRYN